MPTSRELLIRPETMDGRSGETILVNPEAVGFEYLKLIRPQDVEVEVRGGGNATRQINHIIKPEFPAHRLLMVEVYTPSGNWSSYPPHKHDVHNKFPLIYYRDNCADIELTIDDALAAPISRKFVSAILTVHYVWPKRGGGACG